MLHSDKDSVLRAYENAESIYKDFGIDTVSVMDRFREIPISLHCWQGDDIKGFEDQNGIPNQSIVTGSYPGAARNGAELRSDINTAFSLSPCSHRVNLHAMYAEPASKTDRNLLTFQDFEKWALWARSNHLGIDFNATFSAHPMVRNGFTLASKDEAVRKYWIEAGMRAREIANGFGEFLGSPCINNIWIPDGFKDNPADRFLYCGLLEDSLNQILAVRYDPSRVKDVLEGKLFGIGTESFVVGSHEFYLAYAVKNGCGICMDTGHYHPTENVADKLSSVSRFVDHMMLHISRGIRWDSDHVVIQSDELASIFLEIKRGGLFHRVSLALDYFDGSINRVAAWAIGLRAAGKSLLHALLEPTDRLSDAEQKDDFTLRLALSEEFKNLPVNAVWDMICLQNGVPVGGEWIEEMRKHDRQVQSSRG